MGPRSMLVLLAAPKAADYYPKIGFKKHESAWVLAKHDSLVASARRQGKKDDDAG